MRCGDRYNTGTMNQKSITFRCSSQQQSRLNEALADHACNRTVLITDALEAFLNYAEQEHIRRKNLFDLVEDVDTHGHGPCFAEQA